MDTSALVAIVLSFFTLSAMAHLIDAARKQQAEKDPVKAMLSLVLFPFLLAGPLVRRSEMHDQLSKRIVSVANSARSRSTSMAAEFSTANRCRSLIARSSHCSVRRAPGNRR